MTNSVSFDSADQIVTGVRINEWGWDAFDVLDKYIKSRSDNMKGINALGPHWDHDKYDLPAGEYKRQYEAEKDIKLNFIRDDAKKLKDAATAQSALEDLRHKAVQNLRDHWASSDSAGAQSNFDQNRQVAVTNAEAAKQNGDALDQVANTIESLLKDKQAKTDAILHGLVAAIGQNDLDFEKRCNYAARNMDPDFGPYSANWVVSDQENSNKWSPFRTLLKSDEVVNMYNNTSESDGNTRATELRIYDSEMPTRYVWGANIIGAWDSFISGQDLVALKDKVNGLFTSNGDSRLYHVARDGAAKDDIWARADVRSDIGNAMGIINDACQHLLDLNENTKNAIAEQYKTMAGILDNINTAPPKTPTAPSAQQPGSPASPAASTSAAAGAAGAKQEVGGPGKAGLGGSGADRAGGGGSTGAMTGGAGGGGGGDAMSGAMQGVSQAAQGATQAMQGMTGGLGQMLSGLFQGIQGIVSGAIQEGQKAAQGQQAAAAQADKADGKDADGKDHKHHAGKDEDDKEDKDGDDNSKTTYDEKMGTASLGDAGAPAPGHAAATAHAAPSAATAGGAGGVTAPRPQQDGGGTTTTRPAGTRHGEEEVHAPIRQVPAPQQPQPPKPNVQITGFE